MSSPATVTASSAVIHEVFSGIQGEGVLVGYRQVFVRFHGCNLGCAYCDTPASHSTVPAACAVEQEAGTRALAAQPNPFTPDALLQAIRQLQEGYLHHSVSLTGGEPLLHFPFLCEFLPLLHFDEVRSYLETNGTLAEELKTLPVVPHYMAMDMKLPSVSGQPPQWKQHEAFLDAAIRRLTSVNGGLALPDRLQVKLVFAGNSLGEVEKAARLISRYRRDIPCILQPVTSDTAAPSPAVVLDAQRIASNLLTDVRVIPQTHPLLGQW